MGSAIAIMLNDRAVTARPPQQVDGDNGVAAEIPQVLRADDAGLGRSVSTTGSWNMRPKTEDQRHDQRQVFADACLQVDFDLAARLLHRQKNFIASGITTK